MLKLGNLPSLAPLQPLEQEVENNKPPVINTYSPEVERWRNQVWDQMPVTMRQRPDADVLLDKALYAMFYESGGNSEAVGDGGAAWGLFQSHHIPGGSDARTQIDDMWRLASKNPDQWTDWGEGATYEGKPFGAFGNHPYTNPRGQTIKSSVAQSFARQINETSPGISITPTINFRRNEQEQSDLPGLYNMPPQSGILGELQQDIQNRVDPAINFRTGGVVNSPSGYGPFQDSYTSPYAEGHEGQLQGELRARREGKTRLSNAALAAAVAAPAIAAGPAALVAGTLAGEAGHYADERLGLPRANLPIVGEIGPLEAASNLLGAKSVDEFLNPARLATAGAPVNPTKPWLNVVKPRIRTPMRIPGTMQAVDPAEQYRMLKEAGYDDAAIAAAFGEDAVRSGQAGVNLGAVENAQRIETESAANAEYFRSRAKASEGGLVEIPEPVGRERYKATAAENARSYTDIELRKELSLAEAKLDKPVNPMTDIDRAVYEALSEEMARRLNPPSVNPPGAKSLVPPEIKDPSNITPEEARAIYEALEAESQRLDTTGTRSTEQASFVKDLAYTARILGDPFGELVIPIVRKQGSKYLKQAIDDAQEENKREQLDLGLQGGQMGLSEGTTESTGRFTTPEQTRYPRFDAESVAERQRLSQEYAQRTGQPQMSEEEYRTALDAVRMARQQGMQYPPNWDINDINRYRALERGLGEVGGIQGTGEAFEGAVRPGSPEGQTALRGVETPPLPRGEHFGQQVYNEVSGLAGKFLSLKSSLSPPLLRQGLGRLLTNPKQAFGEFGLSLKGSVNETAAREIDNASFQHQWISPYSKNGVSPYKGFTADEVGLHRFDWGEDVPIERRTAGYEGRGASRIARVTEKIPTGEGISERQSALQQNLFGRGRYSEVAQRMWDFENAHGLPHVKKDYEDLASIINHSQQYGGVGQRGIPLLFSSRALSGRVQAAYDSTAGLLTNLAKDPTSLFRPGATQEAAKNLIAFVALNYSLAMLASEMIPGADIQFTPLPNVRIGEHHYDLWGGMKPVADVVVDVAKIWQKAAESGDVDTALSDTLARTTIGNENTQGFLRNAVSPLVGTAISIGSGKDFLGQPYKVTEKIKSGELFKELGLNFVAEAVWDAFKADSLKGVAMDLPLSVFSGGVNTYNTARDRRRDAAQELFNTYDYESLSPAQKNQIEQRPEVKQAIEAQPSDYRATKQRLLQPIEEQQTQAEQAFLKGELSQPLPEIWKDLGLRRLEVNNSLKDQFAKMFDNFDRSKFDKAVEGYYQTEVKNTDGTIDFEATEAQRQDYVSKLPQDQQQWIDEALQVSRANKSPMHQKYLNYIDERKKLGYFDIKPEDPLRNQKIAELDARNPQMDALNWLWKGGVQGKENPRLNSNEAVNVALSLAPDRPIQYAGLNRQINQSPGSIEFWKAYGQRIDNYFRSSVPKYADQIARQDFQKSYNQLDRNQQASVSAKVLRMVRNGSPELRAALQYAGNEADANGDYVVDREALSYLQTMINKYGNQPIKAITASGRPSKFMVRD